VGVLLRDSDLVVRSGAGYNDGEAFILTVRRVDVTLLELRINGVPVSQAAIPPIDISAPTADLFIGAHGMDLGNPKQLRGEVAEIIGARSATEEDVQRLEAYLIDKYAPSSRNHATFRGSP
jgi:hypothetical protein